MEIRKVEYFNESEIPYGTLAKFGLTREMIESFPRSVMNRLLSSRPTPILPLVAEEGGNKVSCQGRIALRRNHGKVDVIFYPTWDVNGLEDFTSEEQEKLRKGDVVHTLVNNKGMCYVQLDRELNMCMFVPGFVIHQNIDCLAQCEDVSDDDILRLKNDMTVEIKNDNELITIGIDLNTPLGLRMTRGNTHIWKKEKEEENLPEYSFGMFGCWVNDGGNGIYYVAEEDYTEEMIEQQELMASRNAAMAQMSNIKPTIRR